jgi:hypothetical protein
MQATAACHYIFLTSTSHKFIAPIAGGDFLNTKYTKLSSVFAICPFSLMKAFFNLSVQNC